MRAVIFRRSLTAALAVAAPLPALAAPNFGDRMQQGLANVAFWMGFARSAQPSQAPNFVVVIGNYVNGILGLLGVIFLVLIIWGGFKWMTAGGNEDQVMKAKTYIRNSAIGLSIILLARTITYVFLELVVPAIR